MSEPRTEAGRALLAEKHWAFHAPLRGCAVPCAFGTAIKDIEAEAHAIAIAEMRERVSGLPVRDASLPFRDIHGQAVTYVDPVWVVSKRAVLALLSALSR